MVALIARFEGNIDFLITRHRPYVAQITVVHELGTLNLGVDNLRHGRRDLRQCVTK
jgi:hypothetical protein